jgi:DNA topoisomerase-2
MTTIDTKYVYTTAEESILDKDWAAGSTQHIESPEYIIRKGSRGTVAGTQRAGQTSPDYIGVYETVRYPPALWKIIDEPIVNAIDHLVRNLGTTHPVTMIKISLDAYGRVKIYNNGPGIEVTLHPTASAKLGRDMYVPTFLFGTLFQGSNRDPPEDSIIGGTNGLGGKLSNIFSTNFVLETTCAENQKYFVQQWLDHKSVEKPPIIKSLSDPSLSQERRIPHTLLSFIPDYTGIFKYEAAAYAVPVLADLIRTRAFFAAAYARHAIAGVKSQQPFELWFNDERITVRNITDIANIFFPNTPIVSTTIWPEVDSAARRPYHYPWEVCAAIINTSSMERPQLGNVNGIMVNDGSHYNAISAGIVAKVKETMAKVFQDKNIKFAPSFVRGNLFMFLNTQIPRPSWTGQRKDVLSTDVRKFGGYTLDTKFIAGINEHIQDSIIESIFGTLARKERGAKKNTLDYDKYTPAANAGPKTGTNAALLIAEGDSAMSQISIGLSNTMGFADYGIMSTGGVIINARKECTPVTTCAGTFVKKSPKLRANKFVNALIQILGINPNHTYDPASPSFKREFGAINYKKGIIACVDQDLDGKGNILGLVLNLFELLWPNLIKIGFIRWFCSPIVRAYPKTRGRVLAFYSVRSFEEWCAAGDRSGYDPMYYKGLGTHSREETIHMFKTFHEHLFVYYLGARCHELFEIYFGKLPDLRKIELSKPIKNMSDALAAIQESEKRISCASHLEYETDPYQRDNLDRKLDSFIDGQNQAGRKILDGLLKALRATRKLKVAQLAGYVSEHENYHHGEASLCDSIIGRGFIGVGGKQLPFIVPLSHFGSRLGGGVGDAASARYIWARLNKNITDLIFSQDDYWILPFNFDEGARSEPKYFVPLVPLAILESTEIPSHGWKLKLWARDVFKVIENVRRLIRLGDDVALLPMPPAVYKGSPYEWRGTIKTIRGEPYSFGKYEFKDSTRSEVVITELPLRVWTNTYIKQLRKKAVAQNTLIMSPEHILNQSDDRNVRIVVTLKPGAAALLDTMGDSVFTDGVEEYFQLRDRMDSHINLMGREGNAIMFDNYGAVIHQWFPVRREFYAARIERRRAIFALRVQYLENTIRYIEESTRLNLAKRKKADMEAILVDNQFVRMALGKLRSPKFTPTDELAGIVLRGPKANFDYLLGLSDLRKTSESLKSYRAELTALHGEMAQLEADAAGRFLGAALWERELTALEKEIRTGFATFWQYDDADRYELD